MLKIQGKDYSNILIDQQLDFRRDYKGDIERTLIGEVAAFPVNYIVTILTYTFIATNDIIDEIEQLALTADVLDIVFTYKGVNYKGKFNTTANASTSLRDKNERHKQLTLTFEGDGTGITKENGTLLTIKVDGTAKKSDCYFGRVYLINKPTGVQKVYFANGAEVPEVGSSPTKLSILTIGDINLTTGGT